MGVGDLAQQETVRGARRPDPKRDLSRGDDPLCHGAARWRHRTLMLMPALNRVQSSSGTYRRVLRLVDLSLVANLVLIVICSSYENFLAPIDPAKHPNWPNGLIGIGFSGLKQKLLGSIVAIAAISVLEWFVNVDINVDNVKLAWVVGILITFAVAMLILAVADRVSISLEHDSKK
jgi:uncharacterized protein (TIGR00645 family)